MTFQLVDMLLPVLPMEDMLIIAMGRLLPATDMDMPLPTTDCSTMGQDMNTNTKDRPLLLDRF